MPATSARISRHCSRRAGHRPARQSAPLTWTFGNSCEDADDASSEVHHEALVECFRGCGVREREPGHDLHGMRAGRAAKRARQRKTRHSNSAGMDRCLAGTTRAGRSRPPPSATRRMERRHEPAGDDGTRSDAGYGARTHRTRSRRAAGTLSRHAACVAASEGRGRDSCGSDGPFGICQPTWLTSFGRAQLTRRRFPRQMVIRSSGSCGYESLETWAAGPGPTSPSPAVVTGNVSARRTCEWRRAESAS